MKTMYVCLFSMLLAGGDGKQTASSQRDTSVVQPIIGVVLAAHSPEWMKIPGVVGTGEGQKDGKPCILIFVDKKTVALTRKLPEMVDGFPIVVKEVGKVKALER